MKLYPLALLAGALAFGQANQNVIVQPDCVVSFTFTATGNKQFDNRTGSCSTWTMNYYATGFSGLSIVMETAPDNAGTPGSWSTFTAVTGNNPSTATTSSQATFGSTTSYFPWIRVRVSSVTGSGKIVGTYFAYKLSAKSGSGGGGGGLSQAYTTVEQAGSALTQRFLLNFVSGATCVDNAGTLATDCTVTGVPQTPNYQQSFTSATSVALTHNLNTTATLTQCYDGSNLEVIPNTTTVTNVNVVTVTFSIAQTGYCNVNGLGGSGGGGSTTSGVFASRPACTVAGAVYYSTDIPDVGVCDGSNWHDQIRGMNVTLPSLTSFSNLNTAGATITTNGWMTMQPAVSAGLNIVGQTISIPARPYTVTACFIVDSPLNFSATGILISDGTKITDIQISYDAGTPQSSLAIQNENSVNSFNSNIVAVGWTMPNPYCLRMTDDNTNLTFFHGTDTAGPFVQISSPIGRTSFLGTPTVIGWYNFVEDATYSATATLISWKVQ